ncbi:hypothetical protein E4P42_01850 [Mycobacterium sp. PS03-16]|uniref:hypothetical protein n=1 Tax=Mycobacterium sp. PS03-16 TaxID=2559611 RepID=UPI0010739F47|nr:hypothetical protein [Mycobacterium sp. PS03-16]TFV60960.1 hypothetical protein E4P42_01850 [Mycobacterium sp. PS03-16]
MRTRWALAAATAVCGVIAAPAGLASAQESAQDTINRLQRDGYTVHIDRVGSAPLSDCVVTNVRNPKQVTSWSPIDRIGLDDDYTVFDPVVVSRSVSITLNCAG